ncbi:MAG: glycosyltransferase family 4 protein [Microgenomates group bacterium]
MKKILILNWRCPKNPLSGGAEKVTLEHAKAWVKEGMSITWLAGGFKDAPQTENIEGVHIYRFGSPISIYFLAPFLYWFKWNGNFDLVFDEIHGVPFFSPLWAWKSKKIAYIHEVAQEIWDEMLPFPINILGKLYEKIYFIFYKKTPFLTGSNSTKQDLVHYGIPEKNITVIPHGLFLKPIDTPAQKEKELTLLYVSRLVRMKGIEDALHIFAEVVKKMPSAKFWIVGNGEEGYEKKLHELAKQLSVSKLVTFFGYVIEEKKVELYQKAHFLLHTSVREGFGLVVIESNSQGTPAFVYDSPGLKDVVREGVNGFIFKKGSYIKIAYKLISLYNDPTFNFLAQSSIKESLNYKWGEITKKVIKILLK